MIPLAAHHWMRAETLPTSLDRLRRCGFTAVELLLEPDERDLAALRATLRDTGIACHGVVALATSRRDPASDDAGVRESARHYLRETIDLCADLGGALVPVVPRPVGLLAPTASLAQEWRWIVEWLREGSRYAAPRGVRLGVEALNRFEGYLFNRCSDVLLLADAVGEDNFGVVLDTFHMNIEEPDLAAAIRAAGGRLVDFQIADSTRAAPGLGHLTWEPMVDALDAIGYRGALTAEIVPLASAADAAGASGDATSPGFSAPSTVTDEQFEAQLRVTATRLRAIRSALLS